MATLFLALAFIFLASPFFAVQGLEITLPEKCAGKRFCEDAPENYPYEYLEQYVKDNNMDLAMPQFDPSVPPIRHSGDDTNCKTTATLSKPFSYYDNETIQLVVQTGFFTQYIEEVECSSEGSACFDGLSVKASCHTTKGAIKLYLFDPRTHDIKHKQVPLNMCCSCVITGRSFSNKKDSNQN